MLESLAWTFMILLWFWPVTIGIAGAIGILVWFVVGAWGRGGGGGSSKASSSS